MGVALMATCIGFFFNLVLVSLKHLEGARPVGLGGVEFQPFDPQFLLASAPFFIRKSIQSQ
jgi:hypothetical protein